MKKRVLLSVSDKTGLLPLAQGLYEAGYELVASGGTAGFLKEASLPITEVSTYTKNPEAFGGRMKTLSFPLFSGILYRRDNQDDLKQIHELDIPTIDGVVCNFYPFAEVLKTAKEKSGDVNHKALPELIENIDIGGPSMVRAAAKNYKSVFILTDPSQYDDFLQEFNFQSGELTQEYRFKLASEAFLLTAEYERMIAEALSSFSKKSAAPLPVFDQTLSLRYGENPHQKAFLLQDKSSPFAITTLQGKELSYNNYLDIDAALRSLASVYQQMAPELGSNTLEVAAIIKHQNPCGLVASLEQRPLIESAWNCDPISSFGGIISTAGMISDEDAQFLEDKFFEVLIASNYSPKALEIFSKKKNLRLIKFDFFKFVKNYPTFEWRSLFCGALSQETDHKSDEKLALVTKNEPKNVDPLLYRFSIAAARSLKSNAIALVGKERNGLMALWGAGMGNPNRLISYDQAVEKCKENGKKLSEAVMCSDAFFPFSDIIKKAHGEGIETIIQPGGALRDQEIIDVANEQGQAMFLTGTRHFWH